MGNAHIGFYKISTDDTNDISTSSTGFRRSHRNSTFTNNFDISKTKTRLGQSYSQRGTRNSCDGIGNRGGMVYRRPLSCYVSSRKDYGCSQQGQFSSYNNYSINKYNNAEKCGNRTNVDWTLNTNCSETPKIYSTEKSNNALDNYAERSGPDSQQSKSLDNLIRSEEKGTNNLKPLNLRPDGIGRGINKEQPIYSQDKVSSIIGPENKSENPTNKGQNNLEPEGRGINRQKGIGDNFGIQTDNSDQSLGPEPSRTGNNQPITETPLNNIGPEPRGESDNNRSPVDETFKRNLGPEETRPLNNFGPEENRPLNNFGPEENRPLNNLGPEENRPLNNLGPEPRGVNDNKGRPVDEAFKRNITPEETRPLNNLGPEETRSLNNLGPEENRPLNNLGPEPRGESDNKGSPVDEILKRNLGPEENRPLNNLGPEPRGVSDNRGSPVDEAFKRNLAPEENRPLNNLGPEPKGESDNKGSPVDEAFKINLAPEETRPLNNLGPEENRPLNNLGPEPRGVSDNRGSPVDEAFKKNLAPEETRSLNNFGPEENRPLNNLGPEENRPLNNLGPEPRGVSNNRGSPIDEAFKRNLAPEENRPLNNLEPENNRLLNNLGILSEPEERGNPVKKPSERNLKPEPNPLITSNLRQVSLGTGNTGQLGEETPVNNLGSAISETLDTENGIGNPNLSLDDAPPTNNLYPDKTGNNTGSPRVEDPVDNGVTNGPGKNLETPRKNPENHDRFGKSIPKALTKKPGPHGPVNNLGQPLDATGMPKNKIKSPPDLAPNNLSIPDAPENNFTPSDKGNGTGNSVRLGPDYKVPAKSFSPNNAAHAPENARNNDRPGSTGNHPKRLEQKLPGNEVGKHIQPGARNIVGAKGLANNVGKPDAGTTKNNPGKLTSEQPRKNKPWNYGPNPHENPLGSRGQGTTENLRNRPVSPAKLRKCDFYPSPLKNEKRPKSATPYLKPFYSAKHGRCKSPLFNERITRRSCLPTFDDLYLENIKKTLSAIGLSLQDPFCDSPITPQNWKQRLYQELGHQLKQTPHTLNHKHPLGINPDGYEFCMEILMHAFNSVTNPSSPMCSATLPKPCARIRDDRPSYFQCQTSQSICERPASYSCDQRQASNYQCTNNNF